MPGRFRNGPFSLLLVVALLLASVGVPLRLSQGHATVAASSSQVATATHAHAPDIDRSENTPSHEHLDDPFCARCLAWIATIDGPHAGRSGRNEARTEPPVRANRPWERRVQVRRHGPRGPPVSVPVPTQNRS